MKKKKINKTKTRHFSKVTKSKEMTSTSSTTITTQFLVRKKNLLKWIIECLKFSWMVSKWEYY